MTSPAKTFINVSENNDFKKHDLLFQNDTDCIVRNIKKLSKEEIQKIFKISSSLTEITYELYDNFYSLDEVPAILTFNGIAYKSMNYSSLKEESKRYLRERLIIISALYGVVRPYDCIRQYRLDFNNNILINNKYNLIKYWDKKIYNYVKNNSNGLVINLASKEYSQLVYKYLESDITFVNVEFRVRKNDKYLMQSTSSKIMRGRMIRFMAEKHINNIDDIKGFNEEGFIFNPDLSSYKNNIINLVFTKN